MLNSITVERYYIREIVLLHVRDTVILFSLRDTFTPFERKRRSKIIINKKPSLEVRKNWNSEKTKNLFKISYYFAIWGVCCCNHTGLILQQRDSAYTDLAPGAVAIGYCVIIYTCSFPTDLLFWETWLDAGVIIPACTCMTTNLVQWWGE